MHHDWAMCRYLAMEKGIVAIPPSAFYSQEHKVQRATKARITNVHLS